MSVLYSGFLVFILILSTIIALYSDKNNIGLILAFESILISIILILLFIYSKKLYIKKFPDSKIAVEDAKKVGNFRLNKTNKFELNFFFLYILATALIFQWQYDLALPLWREKTATHWNLEGVANGWMLGADSFIFTLFILAMGFGGVVIGFIISKFFNIKNGFIITPFSISILWGIAATSFFAFINNAVFSAHFNSGKFEAFSGYTGLCAVSAIAFFAAFIVSTIAASIYISIAYTKQIQAKL